MFVTILETILAFLKTIPIFAKFFPTEQDKVEDVAEQVREEETKLDETGRPTW